MEMDKICKFPRIGNGRGDSNNKLGQKGEEKENYPEDEEDGEVMKRSGANGGNEIVCVGGGGLGRLSVWPSSRIVRVSRASGGKDRHSKVLTSTGLRDRRVRLSVTTAIQFYDLQDRLGFDQPSKAVEWLLKAAAKSIDELPPITTSFPDTPKQLTDGKRSRFESTEVEFDGDNPNFQQQHVSLSKSACSSTSETSKGSGLTLSRSENRVKARERARGRREEKEKEKESENHAPNHPNVSHISQSTFTELLTGGINNVNSSNNNSPNGSAPQNPSGGEATNLFQKTGRHWSSAPLDYFSFAPSPSRQHHFSNLGNNSLHHSMTISPFNPHHHHSDQLQHFAFVPDQLIPATTGGRGGGDYNRNFKISSSGGLAHAGLNRGTLQSNSSSPSLLPHIQRLSSSHVDGSSNSPFFVGTGATSAAAPMENHHHHQFPAGLDGRLQLCYGDRHSDHKGKNKN